MAWLPIAQTLPQYSAAGVAASGYVLKCYQSGTTTVINIATDSTGGTTVTSVTLDSEGYPSVSGTKIIPHVEESYKIALYPDQAAADADTGATWTIDGLTTAAISNTNTDESAKVSANDTTAGYLNGKLVSGDNISFTENNNGSNETLTLALLDRVQFKKGADIASASALTLGTDGNYFDVTGTTPITSISAVGVGAVIKLHFDSALTLTHNATDLILPGGANITTATGDEAEFIEYATGDWRCTSYQVAAQNLIEPQVTNHVRAGRGQIWDGTNSTATTITLTLDTTFRSYGPTGSGVNEWTALDQLPSNARILKVNVEITARADTSSTTSVGVYTASGDVASPSASGENDALTAFLAHYPDTAPTGNEGSQIYFPVEIPLNASQVFKIAAPENGSGSNSCQLHYRGFITD